MSNFFKNTLICPETTLQVHLEARLIPDQATVSKGTGDKLYLLRHNLVLHSPPPKKQPVTLEGFFIISNEGNIQQLQPDHVLKWHVAAEDLVDGLQLSWGRES